MNPTLKTIRINSDNRVAVAYSDGLGAELDFSEIIDRETEIVRPLAEPAFFAQAYIDHGALAWPNGYDVCPDVLRFWAEQGRVCSKAETDAYFATLYASAEPQPA